MGVRQAQGCTVYPVASGSHLARSSPSVFELDWGWRWVTYCLGLPTGVSFWAIPSPATAPCFTSYAGRHLLSGFNDSAFPRSANICCLWLSASAGHPGWGQRRGWPRANSVRLQRMPVSSGSITRGVGTRTTRGDVLLWQIAPSGLRGQTGACSEETKCWIGPQVYPVKCG